MIIPLFLGFHTSQVVQDFSHQQSLILPKNLHCYAPKHAPRARQNTKTEVVGRLAPPRCGSVDRDRIGTWTMGIDTCREKFHRIHAGRKRNKTTHLVNLVPKKKKHKRRKYPSLKLTSQFAPENRPLEKEIPIGNQYFQVRTVSFREGNGDKLPKRLISTP